MHRNPFAQFFSASYDQLRMQNQNVGLLCMNSTDNWNSKFHDASPDDHPVESTRVRFSESIGSWPWDKTETTTRNIAKRTRICLLLAVNSAYFLGQFSINIFLSCSHRHTKLKKTFLTLQASDQNQWNLSFQACWVASSLSTAECKLITMLFNLSTDRKEACKERTKSYSSA